MAAILIVVQEVAGAADWLQQLTPPPKPVECLIEVLNSNYILI